MSDKNLEQWINIKFCVKMKKSSVFSGIGCSVKDEKMCKMTQEVGSQKHKGQMQK
jgi:hypothetical protein